MFRECSQQCEEFHVLLHTDPSIERPHKLKPILSVEERFKVLMSIRYITNIHIYTFEKELVKLLETVKPDVRFLGDDYREKKFTGDHLDIPIYYLNRDHGWSTTKFKKLIHDEYRRQVESD